MGSFTLSLEQPRSSIAGAQEGRALEQDLAFAARHCPVAILLSTFEGAAFLAEQLESFAVQTHTAWILYWRDDGSTDESVAIVEAFAEGLGKGRCIRVADDPGSCHLGITGSFMRLLRALDRPEYVAFADQDDVWLPDKIERGMAALGNPWSHRPALYYARQQLVDHALKRLGLSPPLQMQPEFPASLTQNMATGCTMMLNAAAAALVAMSSAPDGSLHDWWSYLLVDAAGGRLIADPAAVVLYRQHGRNAVGAPHSLIRRGLMALHRGPDEFMQLFRAHVAGLAAQRELLCEQAKADLALVEQALAGGKLRRLNAIRQLPQFTRRTWIETLLFRFWFLIG